MLRNKHFINCLCQFLHPHKNFFAQGYHFVAPPLKTAGIDDKALAKSLEIEKKEVKSSKGVVAESLEVGTKQSWAPAKVNPAHNMYIPLLSCSLLPGIGRLISQVVVGPLTPRVSFDQLYEIFSTFGEVAITNVLHLLIIRM